MRTPRQQAGPVGASVFAFDGKLVRGFTEFSFNHIVSGSSNKYDTTLDHDIDFAEKRAAGLRTTRDE